MAPRIAVANSHEGMLFPGVLRMISRTWRGEGEGMMTTLLLLSHQFLATTNVLLSVSSLLIFFPLHHPLLTHSHSLNQPHETLPDPYTVSDSSEYLANPVHQSTPQPIITAHPPSTVRSL